MQLSIQSFIVPFLGVTRYVVLKITKSFQTFKKAPKQKRKQKTVVIFRFLLFFKFTDKVKSIQKLVQYKGWNTNFI